MAKTPKSETESAEPGTAAQLGNGALPGGEVVGVDKIRDLLFGNQMQDYDRRFSKLEERFLQRFKDIESETARNLSAFESNAKKQVESLAGQLREEIKRKNEDLQHAIEKMFAELSNVKTDRNLLAGLFVEVAKCLNQDVGSKGAGKGGAEQTRGWPAN